MLMMNSTANNEHETLPLDIEADSGRMMEKLFLYIAPINLVLAVIVLFLNSTIQRDYYRDRKLPATFMFMIIAAVDILFATADMYRSSVALFCTQRHDASFPAWFTLSYVTVGFWSYNLSIFANVVLSVIKAVNLAAPFYQLEKVVIICSVTVAGIFWASLSITDAVYFAEKQAFASFGCKEQWDILEHYDFVGSGLVLEVGELESSESLLTLKLLAVFEYMVPSFIVLVCMVIQMVAIKKTLGTRSKDTANEVNMTVFLVSALYFICNSAYGVFFLAEYTLERKKTLSIEFLMKNTLPLLNAALFPIILICRKESLRTRYQGYWTAALNKFPTRLRRRGAVRKSKDGQQYDSVARDDPDGE